MGGGWQSNNGLGMADGLSASGNAFLVPRSKSPLAIVPPSISRTLASARAPARPCSRIILTDSQPDTHTLSLSQGCAPKAPHTHTKHTTTHPHL